MDPEGREKLDAFRGKVEQNHTRETWSTPDDLAGKVIVGLTRESRKSNAVGWVRADHVAKTDMLEANFELHKRIDELQNAQRVPVDEGGLVHPMCDKLSVEAQRFLLTLSSDSVIDITTRRTASAMAKENDIGGLSNLIVMGIVKDSANAEEPIRFTQNIGWPVVASLRQQEILRLAAAEEHDSVEAEAVRNRLNISQLDVKDLYRSMYGLKLIFGQENPKFNLTDAGRIAWKHMDERNPLL